MKITLEIPKRENRKEIEKVYEAEVFELPFEIIDGVLETLDLGEMSNEQIGLAVVKSMKQIRPLMLNVFEGLTKEELGRVNSFKLVPIIVDIFLGVRDQLTAEIKNLMMGRK